MRAFWLIAALAVAGCAPREGSSCSRDGEGRCTTERQALICLRGAWRSVPCRACSAAHTLTCNDAVAREGTACVTGGQRACDEAGAAALICMQATGTWAREAACGGPAGCVVDAGGVTCDDTLAGEGDLCIRADQHACRKDGRALLGCRAGRYAVLRTCGACAISADAGVTCD